MYRPHCVRSVLTTSVKILPYRPPARLIRAKSRPNAQRGLSADSKAKDDIVYKHFNQSDHNGLIVVRIQLIDKCSGEHRRPRR